MKDTTDTAAARSPASSPSCDTPPEPERLLERLARLEALLREHQGRLHSRREALAGPLARAGLDTPQKIEAACTALASKPSQATPSSNACGPVSRRPRPPRMNRTV